MATRRMSPARFGASQQSPTTTATTVAAMAEPMPPGTIQLVTAAETGSHPKIQLHPKPTDDHHDPLNWATWRKALNYGIVIFYVIITFSVLGVLGISQEQVKAQMHMTDGDVAIANALGFLGQGFAGILFIPLTYRFGRRPIYLVSVTVQFAASMWLAGAQTRPEYLICSAVLGVGGSVAQIIVPVTIADLFFVHQFATMNGWFLFAQGSGAFLGPAAAGYVLQAQGLRWVWWWNAIFLVVAFALVLLAMEESTFVPSVAGKKMDSHDAMMFGYDADELDLADIHRIMSVAPAPRALRTRLSLVTDTKRPIKKRFLAPFVILVKFPAVTYAAVTYGFVMACLAMFVQVGTTRMSAAPYNFDSISLGLANIGPFVGHTLGCLLVSPLSDFWIVWQARLNGGVYEPEMRLKPAIPGGILTCGGILLFGLGIAEAAPWPVVVVGFALFAFGFSIVLDIALAYVTDCYHTMIGDALVAIALVRNILPIISSFIIIPWTEKVGLAGVFVTTAVIAAFISCIPFALLRRGKSARRATANLYSKNSLAAIPPDTLRLLSE